MARTAAKSCTKAFLFVYNIFFMVFALLLMVSGVWLHFDADLVSLLNIVDRAYHGPHLVAMSLALLGTGASIYFITLLGCCGACCESVIMVIMYAVMLVAILLGEITCTILTAIFRHKIAYYVHTTMEHQIHSQYNRTMNTTDILTKAWDRIQVDLECCGTKGPQDYRYSIWFNSTQDQGNFVPPTCCYMSNWNPDYPMVINDNQCQIDAILFPEEISDSFALKTMGCYSKMGQWLKRHNTKFLAVAWTMVALQIMGLILAFFLIVAIRRERSKYPWYREDDDYTRGEHSYRFITAHTAAKSQASSSKDDCPMLDMGGQQGEDRDERDRQDDNNQ